MFRLNKVLFISLVVAILATVGGIVYLSLTPNQPFTEFYLLNSEGEAKNYPQQVMLGEEVELIVGVVNREYQPTSYLVEITINGASNKEINVGTLAQEQKWEQAVSFVAPTPGDKQRVEFWLYKDSGVEPYLQDPLRLYIDVRQPD